MIIWNKSCHIYADSKVNVFFKCFRFWAIKALVLIAICVGAFFIPRGEFGIGVYQYIFIPILFLAKLKLRVLTMMLNMCIRYVWTCNGQVAWRFYEKRTEQQTLHYVITTYALVSIRSCREIKISLCILTLYQYPLQGFRIFFDSHLPMAKYWLGIHLLSFKICLPEATGFSKHNSLPLPWHWFFFL